MQIKGNNLYLSQIGKFNDRWKTPDVRYNKKMYFPQRYILYKKEIKQ